MKRRSMAAGLLVVICLGASGSLEATSLMAEAKEEGSRGGSVERLNGALAQNKTVAREVKNTGFLMARKPPKTQVWKMTPPQERL